MKPFISLLLVGCLTFTACKEDSRDSEGPNGPSNSLNTIMCLGASRVEGNRPDFESFRYDLWKNLVAGDWTFDYIGTRNDESDYPNYLSEVFDNDHEGRSGWTSGEIRSKLNLWLNQVGAPDFLLFSSPAGNDALEGLPYEEALENINAIIDKVQNRNPSVTILIEKMAPARSDLMNGDLQTYMNQLSTDLVNLAESQSDSSSQVIIVDMQTGFKDAFLADEVHYNAQGAKFIADRYYQTLAPLLTN